MVFSVLKCVSSAHSYLRLHECHSLSVVVLAIMHYAGYSSTWKNCLLDNPMLECGVTTGDENGRKNTDTDADGDADADADADEDADADADADTDRERQTETEAETEAETDRDRQRQTVTDSDRQ